MDVFDVNTMEWIQTMPLKNVHFSLYLQYHIIRKASHLFIEKNIVEAGGKLKCSVLMSGVSPALQVHPLNADGSLNLLGLETVRLIYFKNKTAGEILPLAAAPEFLPHVFMHIQQEIKDKKMKSCFSGRES